jgi:hypothetical protein
MNLQSKSESDVHFILNTGSFIRFPRPVDVNWRDTNHPYPHSGLYIYDVVTEQRYSYYYVKCSLPSRILHMPLDLDENLEAAFEHLSKP